MKTGNIFVRGRNFLILSLSFLIPVLTAGGQTPTQTPPEEILRIDTELIQTDVSVVDKAGRFVDNLKRDQFELRVDGKPQRIDFFERVRAGSIDEESQRAARNNTNAPPPPAINASVRGRTIIFFVDDLHLSLSSLTRARAALLNFINDKMSMGDQVAIASSSGQIGFLQQFTNNKAVLRAAAARLQHKSYTVVDTEQPPMTEYMALRIEDRDRNAMGYYVERCVKENMYPPLQCVRLIRNRAREILSRAAAVTDNTFYSLESLMRTMTLMSGRKVIMMMSDGFYLSARDRNTNSYEALQRVTDTARRSGTVIYTIDARGLGTPGQSDSSVGLVDFDGNLDKASIGEVSLSQDALNALARETGGRALRNSGSITNWVTATLEETSNYYLLAWQPEKEAKEINKFKQIEVSIVGRPDLTVRLQRGYLANRKDKDADNKKSDSDKTELAKTGVDPKIKDSSIKDSSAKAFLPISLSLSYLDVPGSGAVLTSSVQVGTRALNYGAGGDKPASVDVAGVVFNEQGKQVAGFKTGLSVTPPSSSAENNQSIIYNSRTPLAPGLYQVRVAARETQSGQAGNTAQWIEIPDLSKRQLTLSSLLLDAQAVKKTGGDESIQVQFSVDHRFALPFNLNFLSFVYNAARTAGGEVNLTTQITVFDAQGRAVINTPVRPLTFKGTNDLSRIPLKGSIRQDLIAPGNYLLQVKVNDTIAGTNTVQQTAFTVE